MPGEGSVFPVYRTEDGRRVLVTYRAQVSCGPRSGRHYLTRSLGPRKPTRAEERAALDELRAESEVGSVPSTETTGDYLVRWANDARNIRPNTRRGYMVVVTQYLVPEIGDITLRALTPADVEGMLARLEASVAPKYLRNIHAALRRALNQAVRTGLVERNVASRQYVDAPRVDLKDPEALSDAQLAAILRAAEDDRLYALFVTLAECGLRMGEALGLAWEDIRPDSVRVDFELAYRDGQYTREAPKTDRSRRVVPLSAVARAALDAHRERTIADGFVPTATGPVFTNTTGGPLSGSWVTHRFYRLCADAGLDRRPPKILRATFSSRLHRAGVDSRTIADLMGHARERTTQRHYIATSPERAQEAVARLGSQSPSQSPAVGQAW